MDYKKAYYELRNAVSDVVHHNLTHVADGKRFYDPIAQDLLEAVRKSEEVIS